MSSQWLGQCPQCGLIKSSGVMGTILPQCMCDWKMQPPPTKREWVNLTLDEIALLHANYPNPQGFALALQAKLKEKNT